MYKQYGLCPGDMTDKGEPTDFFLHCLNHLVPAELNYRLQMMERQSVRVMTVEESARIFDELVTEIGDSLMGIGHSSADYFADLQARRRKSSSRSNGRLTVALVFSSPP